MFLPHLKHFTLIRAQMISDVEILISSHLSDGLEEMHDMSFLSAIVS